MKIVILDGYAENPGDLSWYGLEALGNLTVYDRTPITDEAEIQKRIGDAEIVLTNKVPVSKATIDTAKNLKLIAVLATGYNIIDTEAAKAKGVTISNVPTYGTAAVAQFAIALLLEICHHVGHHDRVVHEGRWETNPDWCFWDYPIIELADKAIGIIGFGRIGQSVGKIAAALGMNVLACDEYQTDSGKAIGKYVTLDELFAGADVISLHCPLLPATQGIINRNNIAKMKDGVILLNNSRGPLVVEPDLADALNSGKIAAAGLDVVSSEPIKGDNPLLKAKNCFITPHISWAPIESRRRLMDIVVGNVKGFIEGKPVNVV